MHESQRANARAAVKNPPRTRAAPSISPKPPLGSVHIAHVTPHSWRKAQIKTLQFVAILLTAIGMAAGWAHLLELPNKIALPAEEHLTVQQIYRGWALLGIPILGALAATAVLTFLRRGDGRSFLFTLAATLAIATSLVVFFSITFPTNQATQNWTILPEGWQALRRKWEYSHLAGALLYTLALSFLVLSLLADSQKRESPRFR